MMVFCFVIASIFGGTNAIACSGDDDTSQFTRAITIGLVAWAAVLFGMQLD